MGDHIKKLNNCIQDALDVLDIATPGPWNHEEYNKILDEKGNSVALCAVKPDYSEVLANAKLIAAVPDLAAEVIRLRKIIATLSRCANKLEMDGVARMSAEERGKWLDKQVEEIETRDENIAEGYGLERKWFAESEGE